MTVDSSNSSITEADKTFVSYHVLNRSFQAETRMMQYKVEVFYNC